MTQKERDELLIRMDMNVKNLLETRTDHEKRVRSLERKWWTVLGAAILSVASFVKSLFPH